MSDDLISRKAVLEILYDISSRNYGSFFGHGINKACDVIEHAKTAFDKEKVIEELREMQSHSKLCKNQCGFTSTEYFDYMGAEVAYGTAIEIVEKGGIE